MLAPGRLRGPDRELDRARETSTSTSTTGSYLFLRLPAGTYTVTVLYVQNMFSRIVKVPKA